MQTSPALMKVVPEDDHDLPVSERIRARLARVHQRYHANDNIAAYLRDGPDGGARFTIEFPAIS